ncbi:MAG TPA: ClpX C4-type zinc finger protein [Mycobacteriales bacterium]|nr:ClpX C4-type zinc finger protein [Mycobacteriales bacterium]
MASTTSESWCTFCTKPAHQVDRLIAGAGVYICNECVGLCGELLSIPRGPSTTMNAGSLSDQEILNLLPQVATVASQVEDALNGWVRTLRDRGVSWARIGTALGMARQSAWERFSGEE